VIEHSREIITLVKTAGKNLKLRRNLFIVDFVTNMMFSLKICLALGQKTVTLAEMQFSGIL
jgi:hypothetical protein